MSLEHQQSPLLEEFVQRHSLTDREKATLERWFDYSGELSKRIVQWYDFHNRGYEEKMAAADWRNDDDALYDTPNSAHQIIPFFEKNYDTIASFPPALGTAIVLPTIWHCGDKNEEAQGILDGILAFLADDSGPPVKSRKRLINFLGKKMANEMDHVFNDCCCHSNFTKEDVRFLSEAYHDWQELYVTDKTKIGLELLLGVAKTYLFPVLSEEGVILGIKKAVKYMSSNFQPLWQTAQAYKRHFNPQSEVKLPSEIIVRYLLKTMQVKKAEKAFEYLGKLQKQLEGIELPFPVADLAQAAISLLEKQKYGPLDNLLQVIGRQQCQTLEEALECAELNLQLESFGYKVHRRITSEGTFKEVYLAEDRFGTECVLKKIIDERVAAVLEGSVTPEGMVRKELKSSPFQMRHPNINPTIPLFSGKTVYLLEPKYEETMAEFARQKLRPPNLEAGRAFMRDPQGEGIVLRYHYASHIISVMQQMADALKYCHDHGVVHGDFKLDNVGIIKPKWGGEEIHALLNDFGMATYDQQLTGKEELNYNLGRVYTKHPDLFRKGSHPSKQTDIFAFGAELFFLCTGRYPFSEEDEIADYRQLEERKKYYHRVHSLVKKGENCWKEALELAIDRYMPSGVMAINGGAFITRSSAPDSRVIDYNLAEELSRLNKYCFNQSSSANNNPFEGVTASFNLILREIHGFNV